MARVKIEKQRPCLNDLSGVISVFTAYKYIYWENIYWGNRIDFQLRSSCSVGLILKSSVVSICVDPDDDLSLWES